MLCLFWESNAIIALLQAAEADFTLMAFALLIMWRVLSYFACAFSAKYLQNSHKRVLAWPPLAMV
jgi:membrane protein CcdC involved in cytochrome C biogenesis